MNLINSMRSLMHIHRRALARAVILFSIIAASLIGAPARRAQDDICRPPGGGAGATKPCFDQPLYDIGFILDSSGSIAQKGQTYNLELEGIINALSDPTIIPRDGTVALSVFTFSGGVNLRVPFTVINSEAAAQAVVAALQAIKCPTIGSINPPCPTGETLPSGAVLLADAHMSQNRRPGARRALVMATDGVIMGEEVQRTIAEVTTARNASTTLGVPFEFDVVLMGLDTASQDFNDSKARVDQFVTPQPVDNLPGATFAINAGACNQPDAAFDSQDCQRQATEFAEIARNIIRADVQPIQIVVNTEEDTPPGAPIGQTVSLRQALEAAACNGGAASISFASALAGKTIRPLVPLPPISQPDTVIDGCEGEDCQPSITIDGSDVDAQEGQGNGLVLRSNRSVIRGVRIINFPDSAIALNPLCPRDTGGRNLIEKSVFENNGSSGVTILNSPFEGRGDNTGNTISQNTISGSPIPIDLGGDGATPNDVGDGDTGPNTLINFPDNLMVTATGTTVTVTGQVNGPAAACSKVEIFGVTSFDTPAGTTNIVITGVTFLAEATSNQTGAFSAIEIPASPTGIYAATVTDCRGNTSEMISGTAIARPMAQISATSAAFGNVQVNSTPPTRQIQITNTGNAPLMVSACQLARCTETGPNDAARFTISGCPTAPLNPGEQATVTITFLTAQCGPARVCLNISSNDPRAPLLTVEITGNIIGAAQARVILEGGGDSLDFGRVTASAKPKKPRKRPARTFTIENTGCDTLTITILSIRRTGGDVSSGRISNPDDTGLFSISQVAANGAETPVTPGSAALFNISSGQRVTFRVRFSPVVPAVANATTGLSASQVLPDRITSEINILQTASPLSFVFSVDLEARVNTPFRLIHPDNPRLSPLVTLVRAGAELSAEFSVYDSNRDISRARYEFFDRRGRQVGDAFDISLSEAIAERNLVRGQSFRVLHRFGDSFQSFQVRTVRVTVFDSEGSQTAESGPVVVTSAAARRR
ncbi:MAG: choice-of-anchor D domain-containing protein [Acidobacteriota bacterium]